MANDLNQCNFIGRLGKDPEIRAVSNGKSVANFSIAVGESWRDKQSGEKVEKTEWVNCVAWDKLAEIIGQYVAKGSKVYVSGKFTTEKYQDSNGFDKYATKIIVNQMQMLDSQVDNQGAPQHASSRRAQNQRKAQEKPAQQAAPAQQQAAANRVQPENTGGEFFEDDIPF